jgi:hypothetical protein
MPADPRRLAEEAIDLAGGGWSRAGVGAVTLAAPGQVRDHERMRIFVLGAAVAAMVGAGCGGAFPSLPAGERARFDRCRSLVCFVVCMGELVNSFVCVGCERDAVNEYAWSCD